MYAESVSVSAIVRQLQTNRPKIERCVGNVLQLGVMAALQDLPRKGKPPSITEEARAWVVSLDCQKPKDFGYSDELWTTKLLSNHIKANCKKAGHPCLRKISRGKASKILTKNEIRPDKIKYYLQKRDPDFDVKMEQVLYVYKEVEMLRHKKRKDYSVAILSSDEKPRIQAIENTAPDLPPVPGSKPCLARDHEYVRHGTVSLMAGIDLLTGNVHALVVDRHRSREFVQFSKSIDRSYKTK